MKPTHMTNQSMTNQSVLTCPCCGSDNIPGDEECSECMAPLVFMDRGTDRQRGSFISQDRIRVLPLSVPDTVMSETPLLRAIESMRAHADGCVPVVDGQERLVGIVTERDVLYKVVGGELNLQSTPVSQVMTPQPVSIHLEDTLASAFNRMSVRGMRHLPVLDGDRLVGLVTLTTLLHYVRERIAQQP